MKLRPEEITTAQTYDQTAATWSGLHYLKGFWESEMENFHRLLPDGNILEVGSGGGRDAKELVELGYGYVGTDISTGLIEVARQNLPNGTFYNQSVYDLGFEGRKFDGFWASAVLLHIPKDRMNEALQRIKSVVVSGAIGFISLKDGTGEKVEKDEINGEKLERFFAYWQKDEFTGVLEKNSYKVVGYSYHPMSETTRWHCFFVQTGPY